MNERTTKGSPCRVGQKPYKKPLKNLHEIFKTIETISDESLNCLMSFFIMMDSTISRNNTKNLSRSSKSRAQDTMSAEYRRKQDTKAANGDNNIAKWDDRNDISDNGRCNRN